MGNCLTAPMSEAAGEHLRSGQEVRVRVRSHQPWGLAVEIVGHEGVGASIDYLDIAGPDGRTHRPSPSDFPVGAEIDAVVMRILNRSEMPRNWYYLMIP
jgi:hypothetical protein